MAARKKATKAKKKATAKRTTTRSTKKKATAKRTTSRSTKKKAAAKRTTSRSTKKKAAATRTTSRSTKKKASAKRTTQRSTGGSKLYAKRGASGQFDDIQTYKRAHGSDVKRVSKAETAARKKSGRPARKTATKK